MFVFNMAIKKVAVFLTLVGVALAASHFDERIVGGTDAVTGEFPYVVSLQVSILWIRKHICGASILDKNHILTAAHCLEKINDPALLAIQYGTADISIPDNEIRVVKMTIHSEYDKFNAYANDIAILKLASDIDFGVNAQPVKLPGSSSVPPGDVDAVLIGWGLTASVGGISPTILKKINYTKFSDEYCKATVLCYNPNYHMCAGIIGGGKGQCSGDSGGPLTINGVQYGVVSWSIKPCANPYYPGVLTSVAKYVDWIQEHIQD